MAVADALSEHRPWRWTVEAITGVTGAWLASIASRALGFDGSSGAGDALMQGLALAGLLTVPAAIFTAVIGAMFPNYWRATPQALVRHSPHSRVLDVLALSLGYGLGAVAAVGWFGNPTWLVAFLMLGLVLIGSVLVIRMTAYSLAIMDPRRLIEIISDFGRSDRSTAIDDLARLTRGMIERERKDVARRAVDAVIELLRDSAATDFDRRFLAATLDQVVGKWPYDNDVVESVDQCRSLLRLPDRPWRGRD